MHTFVPKIPVRLFGGMAYLLLAVLLVLSAVQQSMAANTVRLDQLQYYTENYYPYNYQKGDTVKGFSADLLRLVLKSSGAQEEPHIHLQPWASSFRMVQTKPGSVLFSVARTPEREEHFHWACPIDEVRFVLVGRRASGVVVNSLWDLQKYTIGTITDDVADKLLKSMGLALNIESATSIDHNFTRLDNGRIDLLAYEAGCMRNYLRKRGLSPDKYESVYLLKVVPICYAFNPSIPLAVVERFEKELSKVRKTPEFKQLRERYLK